jgi:hypothetical protein
MNPTTQKPVSIARVRCEDGFTFHIMDSGLVCDHPDPERVDMSWPSLDSFKAAMTHEGIHWEYIQGPLVLPPFKPKNWILEFFRPLPPEPTDAKPTLRRSRPKPQLLESFEADTKEEAEGILAQKLQLYKNGRPANEVPSVILREANERDFAIQRTQQIAEVLGQTLDQTFEAEEKILAYDNSLAEQINFADMILPEVEAVLENYPPEDQDPVKMGWVGTNGLP